MFKKLLLALCLIAACTSAFSQVKRKIKKGRRNKSESQFTLDKGYLQAEWEVGHEVISRDLSTTVYPNMVLHYGISKRAEVNAEISFIAAKNSAVAPPSTIKGMEPFAIGANYLLLKESGGMPAVTLAAQLALPYVAGKNFKASYYAPMLQLVFQKPVSRVTTLGASGGAFWDGFSTTPSFVYNMNAVFIAAGHYKFTAEVFGFINGSAPQHNADASFAYVVSKNAEFGITSGFGLSPAAHKSYVAVNGVLGFQCFKKHG